MRRMLNRRMAGERAVVVYSGCIARNDFLESLPLPTEHGVFLTAGAVVRVRVCSTGGRITAPRSAENRPKPARFTSTISVKSRSWPWMFACCSQSCKKGSAAVRFLRSLQRLSRSCLCSFALPVHATHGDSGGMRLARQNQQLTVALH